jgi:hypothetical protein
MRVWCIAGIHRNEPACGDNGVEGGAVYHQILDNRKRLGPPWLNDNRLAIPKATHIELTGSDTMSWSMRTPIDHEATATANAFPTIVLKGNRLLSLHFQALIDDVEHLEK